VFIWTFLVSYLCHSLAAVATHCETFPNIRERLPASICRASLPQITMLIITSIVSGHHHLAPLSSSMPHDAMVRSSGSEVHVQPSDSEREAGVDLQSLLFRLLHHWRRPRWKSESEVIFVSTLAWGPTFRLCVNACKLAPECDKMWAWGCVPVSFLLAVVACDVCLQE
jgi:hypothetical protein